MKVKALHGVEVPRYDLRFKGGEVKEVDDNIGEDLIKLGCFEKASGAGKPKAKATTKKASSFNADAIKEYKKKKGVVEND